MRKMVITLLALGLFAASTAFAANPVRISQVYGGGGGSSVWTYDYVELFNSGSCPAAIGGWSIQYGSSAGTVFGSSATNCAFIPAGAIIPACGYYLVQVGSSGGTGTLDPWPAGGPDLINLAGPSMAAGAGKVALINDQVFPTACAGNSVGGRYVDVVGYGTGTTCYEGTGPSVTLTSSSVAVRKLGGMTDTDANPTDFPNPATGTNSVTIHNSTSGTNPSCTVNTTTGACCLRYDMGWCIITTAADCAAQRIPGVFLGVCTTCGSGFPPFCPTPTPATRSTWGQVKTIYR